MYWLDIFHISLYPFNTCELDSDAPYVIPNVSYLYLFFFFFSSANEAGGLPILLIFSNNQLWMQLNLSIIHLFTISLISVYLYYFFLLTLH